MKKVLIITYYWPPSAGSGVQRWVKFAKYLPHYGWDPIIFTPENPDFSVKDETLLKDISPDLEVLKFPIWEPYQLQRIISGRGSAAKPADALEKKKKGFLDHISIWLRGNVLVPDPRVFWVKPAVRFLTEVIKTNKIDVVITTGPPHSLHLIGEKLKYKTGVKWLADFRDPWSKWEFLDTLYMTPFIRNIHRKLEKSVLKNADSVITISNTFKKDFEELVSRRVNVITNGFDPDDFNTSGNVEPSDKFLISHIGTIDDLRDPRPFLYGIKALAQEMENFANEIEILFVGVVSRKLISEIESDVILSKIVIFKAYVAHHEVFHLYKKSSVLLLVLANSVNAVGNVPGKLFEYMAAEKPIIALGRVDGDSAEIIRNANAGFICDPEDGKGIKDAMEALFNNHKNLLTKRNESIQKYSRKALTGDLVKLLDELIAHSQEFEEDERRVL